MKSKPGVFAIGLLLSMSLAARPAPWFLWKSKLDGKTYCAQASPGDGWEKTGGPFSDAHCQTPV